MNLFRPLLPLIVVFFVAQVLPLRAAETTIKDTEGLTAWLETPTAEPEPGKTYWLVVSVHGAGADGSQSVGWIRNWVGEFDDVIVLAPTFAPPKERSPAAWKASYQMSGPTHVAKLESLIAEVAKTWPLHPKVFLNGFSAGAQFAHRYAMKFPDRVAGVAAHSGGSWAKLEGPDRINPDARSVAFAISCGEKDAGSGGPDRIPRIEAAKTFAAQLEQLGFDVTVETWPEVGHEFTPGANAQGLTLLKKIRSESPNPL